MHDRFSNDPAFAFLSRYHRGVQEYLRWQSEVQEQAKEFRELLAACADEEPIQQFLTYHPFFFMSVAGLLVFSVPKLQLGAEYATDFVLGVEDNAGIFYHLIELERPNLPLFTKSGKTSHYLEHAMKQVRDWQIWIQENLHYIRQKLPAIADPWGIIILGRRNSLSPSDKRNLRHMNAVHRGAIRICTYDSLFPHYVAERSDDRELEW